MVALKISAFAGERPLLLPRLLPETAAQVAMNARLNDGALTPINKTVPAGQVADAAHQTIYRHQGNWTSWPGIVNAAPGPVADDRLYFTGDGVPKVRIGGIDYPLKVSRPAAKLNVAVTGAGTGDTVSRTYVYTYVTSFSEESAPCPASSIVDWKPGQSVTLSGFAAPPGGREITRQRIYRSQTGRSGTFLYFIAERPASAADFVDNIAVDAFQEALPSMGWDEPPEDLKGLITMPNGMMAAFSGRKVWFCEPYRPHAWPQKYMMTVDSEIVGLGAMGSMLAVLTKAQPFIMTGSHPDSMQSQKLEANFPCINARGIVDLGFAVAYPSHHGLVAIRSDGAVDLVTRELFSREDWLALSPKQILGGQRDGEYVLFYDTLDPSANRLAGALFINISTPFISRTTELASAVFYDVTESALFFKRAGSRQLEQFDPPDGAPATLYWRSKEFWTTAPTSMGALLVDFGADYSSRDEFALKQEIERIKAANALRFAQGGLNGEIDGAPVNHSALNGDDLEPVPSLTDRFVTVGVYADGKLVQTVSGGGRVLRLKGGFKARRWEIDISSNRQVAHLVMAASVEELKQVI